MGMLLRRHYKERNLDKNVKPEVTEDVTEVEVKKEAKQAEDKPKKAKASDK